MTGLMRLYQPWWLLLDGARFVVRAAVEARRKSLIWPTGSSKATSGKGATMRLRSKRPNSPARAALPGSSL